MRSFGRVPRTARGYSSCSSRIHLYLVAQTLHDLPVVRTRLPIRCLEHPHERQLVVTCRGPWPFRSARFFTAATVAALTCTVYTCRQSVAHAEQPARVPRPGSTPDQFKVLSITGDGNCMFRALSQGRSFNQEGRLLSPEEEGLAAAGLRKDIVAEMQRQKDFLSLFVTTDWDSYVQNMSRSGTWGGEPELSAAPGVLRAPVHVYQASLPGRPPKLVTEYGSDEHAKAAPVLVLFYGQHYDAMLDEASRASPRSEL